MNKVDFTLKNGRTERMHPKIAELLQRKGKGTYQTTAVQESPQRAVLVPASHVPPPVVHDIAEEPVDHEPQNEPEVSRESVEPSAVAAEPPVDLASMSVEELREHAKRQGVQVHHRAGTKTVIDALKKAEE